MRKIAALLIIAGIIVMLYPSITNWIDERREARLLDEMEDVMAAYDTEAAPQVQTHYRGLDDIFDEEQTEPEAEMVPEPVAVNDDDEEAVPIATLEIAKIDLKVPVLEGATKENMRHATAHMKETTPLGEVGNAAIAGHRMRKKGRLFNRLNEVAVGDQVVVKKQGHEYVYTVFNTTRVKPEDVSVLNRNDKDKVLTLITCDPLVNPTHRLIVHAKIEE
ncbi:class D sortase [Paenibacillus sp. GCM10027626]|uniref:class D sortase n=1 Tax=Paenibacillus sp. GCM10027626 TaxID=3273411 RepID=UPI00362D8F6C